MFNIGDEVYVNTDELKHTGKIQELKIDKAYIRWHKGYASWVKLEHLVKVAHPT